MNFAVIGHGDVVKTKSGGAFKNLGCEVYFASRCNPEKVISQCDAVYIATPPDSHLYYARLAAKHKKPCLVEKPMARDEIEAAIMASLFEDKLYVAYYRRLLPKFLRVKEIIDSGELGKPLFCHIEHCFPPHEHPVAPVLKNEALPWRYKPEINGGGNFVDMGTHHLDLIDYFFGPITSVHSHVYKSNLYNAEDRVVAFFTAGNVNITGNWDYSGGPNLDKMTVVLEQGQMSFSVFNGRFSTLTLTKKTSRYNYEVKKEEFINPDWVHEPLIKSVIEDMNGGEKTPAGWENALRAARVQKEVLSGYGIAQAAA